MNLALEGAQSIALPCSLGLIIPGLALLFASGRAAAWALLGYLAGAGTLAWARATGIVTGSIGGAGAWIAGGLLAAAIVLAWARRDSGAWTGALPAGAVVGGLAAWMWQPCVGDHLATVLNGAPTDGAGTLLPMFVFVATVSIPLVLAAALPYAVPRFARVRDAKVVAVSGLIAGSVLAATIAFGVYDDVVAQLARWSA